MIVADDALARYERATELAAAIRAESERLGSSLLAEGGSTGKALVPHPLARLLAEAERDTDMLRAPARKPWFGHRLPLLTYR